MRSPLIEAACACQLSLDAAGRSGAENMAIDAALLDRANGTGLSFLRLYRFDPPCLSLGRNEPAARYDHTEIARRGVDVVRRPTGGRAVWHEHEVTYAVAAPVAAFGSLRHAYHTIHERIAAALRSLGADATLVLVAGRKLVGSAQVRKGNAFLQHGSILLDGSQEIIAAVSRKPQVASTVTTLARILGRPVTFEEVADAIVAAWGDAVTSPNLHQPPPTSTTLHLDLAPLGIAVKS